MGPDSYADTPSETFPLLGRSGLVALDARGVHHPRAARSGAFVHTPYEEITHIAHSPRAIWLGARRSVYMLPRKLFAEQDAPERLIRSLLDRVAALPGGAQQLSRMAEIEGLSREPAPTRATWGLVALCLFVFVLHLLLGSDVEDVGYFDARLVLDGDWWRLVTANLLHGFPSVPIHLGMNLLGLIALGTLLERPFGAARTLVVMGLSGVASMVASGLAGLPHVVGVSGVVFGLVGAVTWLELRAAERLPAWWRVPRRALFVLIAVSAVLPLLVPIIAGAAHLGGFLAGGAAAALLSPFPSGRPVGPGLRAAAATVVATTGLSLLVAAGELARPGPYATHLNERIARLPGVSAQELNNRAWLIAIDPRSSQRLLEAALLMAERAVSETEREEATLLDTLAEVLFQLGQNEAAVLTIEEAIAHEPSEPYYQEQRRRFTGERDRDDRPPPPGFQPEPALPDGGGITV